MLDFLIFLIFLKKLKADFMLILFLKLVKLFANLLIKLYVIWLQKNTTRL